MINYRRRVKRLRNRLELTQTEFADSLGVTFATVNRWENGVCRPSGLALEKLLDIEREVWYKGKSGQTETDYLKLLRWMIGACGMMMYMKRGKYLQG